MTVLTAIVLVFAVESPLIGFEKMLLDGSFKVKEVDTVVEEKKETA